MEVMNVYKPIYPPKLRKKAQLITLDIDIPTLEPNKTE